MSTSICANAQRFKVDFQVTDDGEFIRTDSDDTFYVFNYDSETSADDIRESFIAKFNDIVELPYYFNYGYDLGSTRYDKETGIISGRTRKLKLEGIDDQIIFDYEYRIQFRDGRFRIDAPKLTPILETGRLQANLWIKRLDLRINAKTQKKELIQRIGNIIVNNMLEFWEKEPDWSSPQEIEENGMEKKYFSLGNAFSFVFPNGTDYAVFNFPGIAKEQLIDAIETKFRAYKNYMRDDQYGHSDEAINLTRYSVTRFNNGIQIDGEYTFNFFTGQ